MPRNKVTRYAAPLAAAALVGAGVYAGVDAAVSTGASHTAGAAVSVTTPAAVTATAMTPEQLYKADSPGVVDIQVTSTSSSGGQNGLPFGFGGQQSSQAEGSGFVLDKNGDIVTNDHVVDGATSIKVVFSDGSSAKATVVGADPGSDLAVIKVDVPAAKLTPLALADSSQVQPGQPVVAIGSPYGYAESISAGIVSGVGRTIQSPNGTPLDDAIQTDAAVNHGNSGGPLIDEYGKVIGVNAQIASNSGEGTGVGFAIPSNTVSKVSSDLIAGKKIAYGYLGVVPAAAADGVKVSSVGSGSPAEKAGLQAGDVITAVDGKAVSSPTELRSTITAHQPGDKVSLTITRDGATKTVDVTLGTRPSSSS